MKDAQTKLGLTPVTLVTAALIVATCIVQSFVGWQTGTAGFGFVPSAVWSPSSWLSILPGQAIPVVMTWVTYVLPHTGWTHMAGNVFGIIFFGQRVERESGSRNFAGIVFLSAVFGAVLAAAVHPRGTSPVAGGSLVGFSLFGMWVATYCKTSWNKHKRIVLTFEVLSVAAIVSWLFLRNVPTKPSLLLAIMWHVLPFVAGWIWFRVAIALKGAGVPEGGQPAAHQPIAASRDP